jgi:hypothetical protein
MANIIKTIFDKIIHNEYMYNTLYKIICKSIPHILGNTDQMREKIISLIFPQEKIEELQKTVINKLTPSSEELIKTLIQNIKLDSSIITQNEDLKRELKKFIIEIQTNIEETKNTEAKDKDTNPTINDDDSKHTIETRPKYGGKTFQKNKKPTKKNCKTKKTVKQKKTLTNIKRRKRR